MLKTMNLLRWKFVWLFVKPWPIWITIVIGIIHFVIYCLFNDNTMQVNKAISAILQLTGGLVVIYSINQNMGMFNRGDLLQVIKNGTIRIL